MRHGKKINHLGRKAAHRHALLSNMASSLILNKRITTTVAKAKALKKYVEPLLTKAKDDSTHSRRTVMSYLQNKDSVTALFGEVAGRIAERAGGYTRIIKFGDVRLGDAAEMCMMELVDFNDLYKKDGTAKKAKTRRSRKGKKEEGQVEAAATEVAAEEKPKKAAKKSSKKED
jgi:ribosomal protein L17